MSFNLTTSGAIIMKAGANAQSGISSSGAALATWCDQAEGYVMAATRYDWIANLSSIDANKRGVLSDVVSSKAAMYVIMYDMSGYQSRAEAQTMLDVLSDSVGTGIKILEDKKTQDFL